MKPHLLMPMAGAGSRFYKKGYNLPKPLIEIAGKPFFYWATRSIEKFVDVKDITFIVLKEHVNTFSIDLHIQQYFPSAKIVIIPEVTAGPVFTCLKGLQDIKDNNAVIFNDCDHMFRSDSLNNFLKKADTEVDGALLTFESNCANYSYVQYDDLSNIRGTIEKKAVSDHAISGAYYYSSADLFKKIAQTYIDECPYNETFLSGMYNIMCKNNMYIKDFLVDFHVEFGTPDEYEQAKKSRYFKDLL